MTPEDNLRMEAVIKRGDEYLRRALKAEARLREAVEALREVRGRAVAGLTHESISARERCHAIKDRCDDALIATAQPEEEE